MKVKLNYVPEQLNEASMEIFRRKVKNLQRSLSYFCVSVVRLD